MKSFGLKFNLRLKLNIQVEGLIPSLQKKNKDDKNLMIKKL